MKRDLRDVKIAAEEVMKTNGISEYHFVIGKGKHNKFKFHHGGAWHTVVFSSTPRSHCGFNYIRQDINKVLRAAA